MPTNTARTLSPAPTIPNNEFAKVREKFGKELSKAELAVAEFIEGNGSATSSDVMSLLSITDRGAQRLLKRLIEKGVVVKAGVGRSTRYKLSE